MESHDEEDPYESEWEQEDSFPTDEEDYYKENPNEGDPEPEPPDHYRSCSRTPWYEEDPEEDPYEDHGEDSWHGETESQYSLERGREGEAQAGSYYEGEDEWGEQEYEENNQGGYEEAYKEEAYVEERPWYETPYSEGEVEHQEETDPHINPREAESDLEEEDQGEESCQKEPYHIYFSGHDQGPEAYLRWAKDMDEWFKENQVPEEERTLIAEETLIEEAYQEWDWDANFRLDCDLSERTWEEMKQLMHKEFVEEPSIYPYYPPCQIPKEPRRWISMTPSKKYSIPKPRKKGTKEKFGDKPKESIQEIPHVSKPKKSKKKEAIQLGKVETKAEQGVQKQSNKKMLEENNVSRSNTLHTPPPAPRQGKCSNTNKFKDQTCYRCHKVGHYAATCPLKKVELLENKIELSTTSDSLIQAELLNSNSSIIHLSLPKGNDTDLEEIDHEEEAQATDIKKVQRPKQDIKKNIDEDTCLVITTPQEKESLKEASLSHANNTESVKKLSLSLTQFVSHDATTVLKSLLNIQEHEETTYLKPAVEDEFAISSAKELGSISLSYPKESIIHLFLGQNVNLISGTK